MKKRNRIYKQVMKRYGFFLLFILFGVMAMSQETDTVFKRIDTSIVTEDSVQKATESMEFTEDTVKKAKYNYYITRDEWTSDSFELREVPDNKIKSLKAKDDFWYADKEFKKEESASTSGTNFPDWMARQKWYSVVAWTIIIGGFLAVLIWFLISSNVVVFRRRSKTLANADDDHANENIFEINYQQEINKAVNENNYRLAVRLMFLRLLKNLSERNVIQYKQGRTNYDYLVQLNNTGYYKDFFRITRNYEYAWYGEFDVSSETFKVIKTEFENFDNRLS